MGNLFGLIIPDIALELFESVSNYVMNISACEIFCYLILDTH